MNFKLLLFTFSLLVSSFSLLATAPITGPTKVCTSGTVTLSDATPGGTWSSSLTSIATISPTGNVTGIMPGTVMITYDVGGVLATMVFTVLALPSPITGPPAVCVGYTSWLSDASAPGTWSSNNTSIATIGSSSGIVTGISPGVTTVTFTQTPTGCNAITTQTIVSTPGLAGPPTVCQYVTDTYTPGIPGGIWSSSNTAVATINSTSGVLSALLPGTVTITYSLGTSGCYTTKSVTILTSPSAITGITNICAGSITTLSNSVTGGTWSSSNTVIATISTSANVTGINAGYTVIRYLLSSSCFSIIVVSVNPLPAAIAGTRTLCNGETTTLYNSLPGGTWSSTANATVTTPNTANPNTITGVSNGTAMVTYATSAGCYATATVTVNATPTPITGTTNICTGSTECLSNSTPGGSWAIFPPGYASIHPTTACVTGLAVGTSTITYYMPATGCSATTTVSISSPPLVSSSSGICEGSTSILSSSISGGMWSSSNIIVATIDTFSGTVTGISAGTATITYAHDNGCNAFTTVTIIPVAAPITGITSLCAGSLETLSDAIPGGTWSSDNTSIATIGSSSGIVTGIAAGTATIAYNTPTGCGTASTVVAILPIPGPITGTTTVCISSTSVLSDAMPGGIWSSSNILVADIGSSSGVVSGIATGTASITYTTTSGCEAYVVINISTLPPAITGSTNICEGSVTTLSNLATGGSWTSDNTTIATIGNSSGILTGSAAGTATITYSIGSGCEVYSVITIAPSPAIITGSPVVVIGSTTTLNSATPGGTWSSSNPGVAAASSLTGTVTGITIGTSIISYTLGTGCFTNITVSVLSLPLSVISTDIEHNIMAYPNPNKGVINLKWQYGNPEQASVVLTDVAGREVYRSVINMDKAHEERQIDLQHLMPGLYFISVQSKNTNYVTKLLIEK